MGKNMYEKNVEFLASLFMEKTDLSLREIPQVKVGGYNLFADYSRKMLKKIDELNDDSSLNFPTFEDAAFHLLDISPALYDPLSNDILINLNKGKVGLDGLTFLMVIAHQYNSINDFNYEANDKILRYDLKIDKDYESMMRMGVLLDGQRNYLTNSILYDNRDRDDDFRKGYHQIEKSLGPSLKDMMGSLRLIKKLKDANKECGIENRFGYFDLLNSEFAYNDLIENFNELLDADNLMKQDIEGLSKIHNFFEYCFQVNMPTRIGMEFFGELNIMQVSDKDVLNNLPMSLNDLKVDYFQEYSRS